MVITLRRLVFPQAQDNDYHPSVINSSPPPTISPFPNRQIPTSNSLIISSLPMAFFPHYPGKI